MGQNANIYHVVTHILWMHVVDNVLVWKDDTQLMSTMSFSL